MIFFSPMISPLKPYDYGSAGPMVGVINNL